MRTAARLVAALLIAAAGLPHGKAQTSQATSVPLVLADFNRDGIPDALIQAAPSGQFTPPTATIAFGSVPYGTFSGSTRGVTFPPACANFRVSSVFFGTLSVGDFNNDGIPDIAFSCLTSARATVNGVMLGYGDGTFAPAVLLTANLVQEVVLGDFNHDGKLDLVMVGYNSTLTSPQGLYLFSGNGDGTFQTPTFTPFGVSSTFDTTTGFPLQYALAADVNGDGYPDIVTTSIIDTSGGQGTSGNVSVNIFGNNKDGTFGVITQGATLPTTSQALGTYPGVSNQVVAGNIFGSGKLDLVVAVTGSAPGILVLKNTSSSTTFSLAAPVKTSYPATGNVQVGSFAGTAFSDLAVQTASGVSILTNDGSGSFTSKYSTLSAPLSNGQFYVADANGDSYSDLYTATTSSTGAIQLAVNLVSGTATATSQPFTLGIGSKAISATWPGNVDFTGSTATGTQNVNGAPAVAAVTSSKNPSLVGDAVTFTVTVASGVTSTVIPTGSLILQDNGGTLITGALDSTGKLTYTTSALTQATHTITAVYAGDAYFASATSQPLSQVVNRAAAIAPTLTWATPAPIAYGTPLSATQLNAAASNPTGAAVPGIFVYTPAAGTILNAGLQALSVVFTPTDTTSFLPATRSVQLRVLPLSPSVTLTLSSGSSAVTTVPAGSALKLTASVNSAGAAVRTGQVNFCDAAVRYCTDVHLLGTAQLTSAGTAAITIIPAIGAHGYKAVFLGTNNAAANTSAQSALTVTGKYPTSTTIVQAGTVGNYTLTATTMGTGSSSVAPTGVVSFLDQSKANASLASAPLSSSSYALNLAQSSAPPTGREPDFVATGDFNGDGKPDLAIANHGTPGSPATGRTVTILLGNGDGTFTVAPTPSTGNLPTSIAVGDFNGDGNADLAVTNGGDNTVTILLGNGNGTFTPAATVPAAQSPSGIAAADFNGDGNADLVVANNGSNSVTILLGNGDGTFTAATSTPATGAGPVSVVVVDFNGDGRADLAIAGTGANGLTILLGNGDGTFTPAVGSGASEVVGGKFASVAAGDFNGDGKPDLVVAGGTSDSILTGSILLGNGDGTFTNASGLGSDPTYSFSLAVRDIDGDGKSDIVVADDNGVTILTSNGDGTFTPAANLFTGEGAQPDFLSLALADFNGDGVPDLAVGNSDTNTATIFLAQPTETAVATATGVSPLGPGAHPVVASYLGDASYAASLSAPTTLTGVQIVPTLTWTPAVSTIVYGTPLGPQQLNAIVTGPTGTTVNGVFTYLPAAGTLLTVGRQVLTVSFTPSDPTFIPVSGTATITVTPAPPVLTWATPASIAYGIPLGSSQLNAIVTGVYGAVLPGEFTYTPAAGTILTPGTQTLNVRFVPTDVVDYMVTTGSVKLLITGITLASVTPSMAMLGEADKTVTLTGSGFVTSSVVQVNGTAVATTYVNPTTLTAVVPAANFARIGTLQVAVLDPSITLTSPPLTITVTASTPSVTLGGPSTTPPGSQPTLSFSINNPYPVALTAVFTLAFAPSVTPATDDPAIQFANGTRSFTFVIPANSTAVPPILLQSGTVAGTITVPVVLTAGGANVTPTTLQPVVITIPPAVPTVSTTTITRNGGQLMVAIHGFSNTREVTQATFHFVGIGGAQVTTPDITAPIGPLFTEWFNSAQSAQYGSTFTYTQIFSVSDNAANIGSVQVTLTNSVGVSTTQTAQ